MNKVYQVYQVSDSTGETLDRIFLAIKAQFSNFECKTIHYSFTRTKNQIDKIISKSKRRKLKPKSLVVLIWSFRSEVIKQEKKFLRDGGKLIFPLPEIEIV